MTGTEKQIKWAEDIIENARKDFDNIFTFFNEMEQPEERIEAVEMVKKGFEEYVKNTDKAADIIGSRLVLTEDWFIILADEFVDTHDESFTKFNKENLLISLEIKWYIARKCEDDKMGLITQPFIFTTKRLTMKQNKGII